MIEKAYKNIVNNIDVRSELIFLKSEIKEEKKKRLLQKLMKGEPDIFAELLAHEDAKVRKNAALILGQLQQNASLELLYQAYIEEDQLYNKSSYLKAMAVLDYAPLAQRFSDRLSWLLQKNIKEEEIKHIREEISYLQRMVLQSQKTKRHSFQPMGNSFSIILTTNPLFREVTARKVAENDAFLVPLGVKITTKDFERIQKIRTYSELLFPIRLNAPITAEPFQAAAALAESNLLELLEKAHQAKDVFYYRLGLISSMPLDKRSDFIKKCSFELAGRLQQRVVNTPSSYEVEIRLYQKKDQTFFPVLRLYTMEDKRFQYRNNTLAASIPPESAALVYELAEPYLKEKAQVLDPFCGVGTMLIEREIKKETKAMFGLDYFQEAIQKAKENTTRSGKNIYYVNRDFFTFVHEHEFDEICTNMPDKGKDTLREQDEFYRKFFNKVKAILKPDGMMILLSNEQNRMKKYLRLNHEFILIKEHCFNVKESKYLFIIQKKI